MIPRRAVLLLLLGILFTTAAFAGPGLHREPRTGWTGPLERLGIDGTVASLATPRNWTVKQFSSYDRQGGANDDQDAELIYDGHVLLGEMEGPGVITRIWTKNPQGTIFIFIDDLERPRIVAPFKSLFTGDLEYHSPGFNLFAEPFVSQGGGGYVSYVPIPFEKACRIIVSGSEGVLPYQVTYAELNKGVEIESFKLGLTDDDVSYFKRWKKAWEDTNFRWVRRKEEKFHKSRHNFWPGKDSLLFPIEGPGVITELEFEASASGVDTLDDTWLAIYFDGQETPSVLSPINEFFGAMTSGASDYDSLVLGRDNHRMWCRYPMPFKSLAEIRIINNSAALADIQYGITWRPGPVEHERYFNARYQSAETVEGEPYRVAEIRGEGHFVGCGIAIANADSLAFLEGDDSYQIDGRPASAFHGTATDDYFNGGWNLASGPFSTPTYGATLKSATAPAGFAGFRTMVTEPVPFRSSFIFELEHGTGNTQPGLSYSSVVYWYQSGLDTDTWEIAELKDVKLNH